MVSSQYTISLSNTLVYQWLLKGTFMVLLRNCMLGLMALGCDLLWLEIVVYAPYMHSILQGLVVLVLFFTAVN